MTESNEISAEDTLRLNVLLAQSPGAIRIDESRLLVYGLTDKGEARIELNPNCEEQLYIRRIKSMLSSNVMGSPGGYPVFLERWTRMGQTRDESLDQLLLLGESEAVVAVAHAPGLTESLAERVWWAMPDVVNARVMLRNPVIAASFIGRELAAFLLEFLPFETEAIAMLESVRLVLQVDLIDRDEVLSLWTRARSKRSMLVGFLHATPDNLPITVPAHPALIEYSHFFENVVNTSDPLANTMKRVFSAEGQAFVQTCEQALVKLSDQAVTISFFEAIRAYFENGSQANERYSDINLLEEAVNQGEWNRYPKPLRDCARSVVFLSALSEEMLNPVFARTDAVGSAMRRKIKPLTDRILYHLNSLKN